MRNRGSSLLLHSLFLLRRHIRHDACRSSVQAGDIKEIIGKGKSHLRISWGVNQRVYQWVNGRTDGRTDGRTRAKGVTGSQSRRGTDSLLIDRSNQLGRPHATSL